MWLGAPAGSIVQRGHEPAIPWQSPFVQLVADDQWWTLIYNGPGYKTRYYADIVTPPEWSGEGRVEFIDLDLDVVMYQDGQVAVLDEDEFQEHSPHYPRDLVEGARSATAEVEAALIDRSAPFDGIADQWLRKVVDA